MHQDSILDDDEIIQGLQEAWEQESSKDELKVRLQGLERHCWLGTEAGCLGCYDFTGETCAGDGSAHKGGMGAGSVCLQQGRHLEVKVGREEEGVSSLRPEIVAALANTTGQINWDRPAVPMRQRDDLNQGVQVDRQRPADDTCR